MVVALFFFRPRVQRVFVGGGVCLKFIKLEFYLFFFILRDLWVCIFHIIGSEGDKQNRTPYVFRLKRILPIRSQLNSRIRG